MSSEFFHQSLTSDISTPTAQPTFTWLKLTIETLEQGVKNVQS